MKKVLFFLGVFLLSAGNVFAQYEDEDQQNTEIQDDQAEITSINDIVNEQQEATNRNAMEKHFSNVWRRRSYVNFVYGKEATLTPTKPIETGVDYNNGLAPVYKAQWYGSLQVGRSYRLHKKTIANVAQFCIDYTGLDLSVAHYEQEGNGRNLYDSSKELSTGFSYTPWNIEKYQADIAMTIGPSLTLSPFTYIKAKGLHFFQFRFYYHMGYEASGLYFKNNKNADVTTSGSDHEAMGKGTKIDWGHGMVKTYGGVFSWKFLGVGYEHRTANLKYKSIETKTYGKDSYEFDAAVDRIYLQIKM